MNYTRTLMDLKDRVQKELVKESVTICVVGGQGIIEFKDELNYWIEDGPGYYVKCKIVGIDCNTGLPVDSKDQIHNYKVFSLENLVEMHNLIVNMRSFTVKPDLFV